MSSRRRSVFRPCIDLHEGKVKQIVGASLQDDDRAKERALASSAAASTSTLKTNFTSTLRPAHYAKLYKDNSLRGGHVIKLGPGNEEAAEEAVNAWRDGLHLGGGINETNAQDWIEKGAEKVIVTSYLFPSCNFSLERLIGLEGLVGKERLVVDVSCRRRGDDWIVAMNRWQDLTDMKVDKGDFSNGIRTSSAILRMVFTASLDTLAKHCSEFLIHAADVEGLCQGIDADLVQRLGEWVTIPTTYAGGARNIGDLELVDRLSNGRVDLTFGSALDIFGGSGVTMQELIDWNNDNRT